MQHAWHDCSEYADWSGFSGDGLPPLTLSKLDCRCKPNLFLQVSRGYKYILAPCSYAWSQTAHIHVRRMVTESFSKTNISREIMSFAQSVSHLLFCAFPENFNIAGNGRSLCGQWEFSPSHCTEGHCTALVPSCRTRAFKGSTEAQEPWYCGMYLVTPCTSYRICYSVTGWILMAMPRPIPAAYG